MRLKTVLLLCAAAGLAACGGNSTETAETETAAVEVPATMTLAEAVANPERGDAMARDQFRNPLETLEFFEVGPGQRVAEIWGGWYTPILASYLAENDGTHIAVLYQEEMGDFAMRRNAVFKERFGETYPEPRCCHPKVSTRF